MENASGSLQGNLGGGEVRLASDNLGLHFANLFPEMWRYRQAGARLLWTLDDAGFTLSSPYLQVIGEEGRQPSALYNSSGQGHRRSSLMNLRVCADRS